MFGVIWCIVSRLTTKNSLGIREFDRKKDWLLVQCRLLNSDYPIMNVTRLLDLPAKEEWRAIHPQF
jgi:hypothetical protein